MSSKIIESFANYLKKNNIFFSKYKSKRGSSFSYVMVIRSISFRDFVKKIGFGHPLKSKLIFEKIKNKDFFVNYILIEKNLKGKIIDYNLLFDDSIFIVNGKELLKKYGYKKYSRNNVKFLDLLKFLDNKEVSKDIILNEISQMRFKKSKGSINSVKIPKYFSADLLRISKYVRLRLGGITFSKRYIQSFNEDYEEILRITEKIFDIKPKFTSKKEPLFCSGVLSDFFSKIIKRQNYIE